MAAFKLLGTHEAKPAQRIVSLAPSITEILVALKLSEKIVGITESCRLAQTVAPSTVGPYTCPDLGKIWRVAPDLIVATANLSVGTLSEISHRIAPVLLVEMDTVDHVLTGIEMIATLAGRGGERPVRAFRARVEAVQRRVEGHVRPRVVRLMSEDPITVPTTASLLYDAVEVAGGELMPADGQKSSTSTSIDRILSFDPEVIVSCGRYRAGAPAEKRHSTCHRVHPMCIRQVEDIATWPIWRETTAARSGRIFPLACELSCQPGPWFITGIERMSMYFHPGTSSHSS